MGAEPVGVALGVEFDVRAEDVGDWAILKELNKAKSARVIGVGIVDEEAAGDEEITGEDEGGTVVIEGDMAELVAGSWEDVHDASAEIDVGDAFGPLLEAEEVADGVEVRWYELYAGQALKLGVAGTMIEMLVRVDDQQREFCATNVGK